MKKFLLTFVAALFAVVSFAQPALTKQLITPMDATTPLTVQKQLDRQPVVQNLKNPQTKILGKRAPRKATIGGIEELEGEFITANHEYTYNSETQKLEAAPVSRKAVDANIEVTGENTIAIYGIDANASDEHPITATVDVATGKVTIPGGQVIWVYTDDEGDLELRLGNAEATDATEPLTGTIYADGSIVLDQVWFEYYEEEGKILRNGYFKSTAFAHVNGIMEYRDSAQNVLIVQDEETKAVTVWNFHDFVYGMVVDADLSTDGKFSIAGGKQVVYVASGNNVVVWSFSGNFLSDLTGVVSDKNKLVSDSGVGFYYSTGGTSWSGWSFRADTFTITLTDGSVFELPPLEVGELVTPPAGLTTKDYPFTAKLYTTTGSSDYTATVKVGWDNQTVYIQGLDKDFPEAWIKGDYNAETQKVGFPVTYTGATEDAVHYFAAYSSAGPDSLFLNYDADADTYDYGATVRIYKGSDVTAYHYSYNGFFIGVKPTPTQAPEGLETAELPYKGNKRASGDTQFSEAEGTVQVGVDGKDVYIKGLFEEEVPGGWLKGTLDGDSVVFKINQYVGNLSNGLSTYLTGYTSANGVGDVVFTYNAENNYYEARTLVILTRFKNSTSYEAYFQTGLLIGEKPSDGISTVKSDVKSDGAVYNLAGQRVGSGFKGLVIKNGKKVVVK